MDQATTLGPLSTEAALVQLLARWNEPSPRAPLW